MSELRAIAPLVVTGPTPELVGPCTLVTDGTRVVAFSSAELLRRAGEPLAIALTLDCKNTIPVTAWTISRSPAMGLIDLGTAFPGDAGLDVKPAAIGSVHATVDTRGAPSALVTVERRGDQPIARRVIPVHVDAVDAESVSDEVLARVASPDDARDVGAEIDGAALLTWMPADPVLGRPSEVVVVALACTYRQGAVKPRALPPVAELWGLDDLGRALPWHGEEHEGSNELRQVAGEWDVPSAPVSRAGSDGDS